MRVILLFFVSISSFAQGISINLKPGQSINLTANQQAQVSCGGSSVASGPLKCGASELQPGQYTFINKHGLEVGYVYFSSRQDCLRESLRVRGKLFCGYLSNTDKKTTILFASNGEPLNDNIFAYENYEDCTFALEERALSRTHKGLMCLKGPSGAYLAYNRRENKLLNGPSQNPNIGASSLENCMAQIDSPIGKEVFCQQDKDSITWGDIKSGKSKKISSGVFAPFYNSQNPDAIEAWKGMCRNIYNHSTPEYYCVLDDWSPSTRHEKRVNIYQPILDTNGSVTEFKEVKFYGGILGSTDMVNKMRSSFIKCHKKALELGQGNPN